MYSFQVNIVPIIAKADTIAKSELKQFKDKVRYLIIQNFCILQ